MKFKNKQHRSAVMASIREQHAGRTPRARSMDARQTANRVLDPNTDSLYPWQNRPNRYDVLGVDDKRVTVKPSKAIEKPSTPQDSVKIITNNMPAGYEIHKWGYEDQWGNRHTSHAVYFEGEQVFDQNKTFPTLPEAREALKEHADTERLRKQVREERAYFEKHGHLGKTGYIKTPKEEPTTPKGFHADPNLIDRELAMRAHSGTSFTPEKRGEYEIESFVNEVEHVRKTLMQSTESADELVIVDREMDKFQERYAKKWNEQMAAHSRIISPMITGGANFPVRRNQKACDAHHKRITEMIEYKERAINAITKKLKEHRIEEAGGEYAVMEQKLAAAEAKQERMKSINKILRNKKTSDKDKIKQVQSQFGMQEPTIKLLMTPDYGKPGFESWRLSNNNANIKRMKERLKEMKAMDDKPSSTIKFTGGEIIDNSNMDRVQIYFDDKPDDAMRAKLRGSGWRWAPSLNVWQRKRTNAAMASAKHIIGVK